MKPRATIERDWGSENEIQAAVADYARDNGWRATKRSGFVMGRGKSGEPDYDFFRKDRKPGDAYCFMIEFKRHGEKPTAIQAQRIKEIQACGVNVYVCDNRVKGKQIVDRETTLAQRRRR